MKKLIILFFSDVDVMCDFELNIRKSIKENFVEKELFDVLCYWCFSWILNFENEYEDNNIVL